MLIRDIELIPAIIDLVDNSADGAKRLKPDEGENRYDGLWVRINVSPEKFVIEDNCGGMAADIARDYAFRFGRREDQAETLGEVGQFGIGMKRALFKMGRSFEVESTSATSHFKLPVNVEDWLQEKGNDWSFTFSEVVEDEKFDEAEHGTCITVTDLHDLVMQDFGLDRFVNRLRREIAQRELWLIQDGLEITVNDERLPARPPALLSGTNFSPIHVTKELPVNGTVLHMSLWAGLVESAGPEDDDDLDDGEKYREDPPAGWYMFCNDRLLLYANKNRLTGWGNEAAAYHPQYGRFRGYVLLDGDAQFMPWNTTKTGVDEDSKIFREVQNEMFDALQKVQAVTNRLKKERRQKEPDARPAVDALATAQPVPLNEIPPSTHFVLPEPSPDPPPTAQWIRYQVDLADFERVAETLGRGAPADVGRGTFDWYLENQVD